MSQAFHKIKTIAASLILLTAITGCSSVVKVKTAMAVPSESGFTSKHFAVYQFSGGKYGISGNDVAQKTSAKLLSTGHVRIDDNSPVQLFGTITPSRLTSEQWRETHEGKKETTYSYHVNKEQSLAVNFTVKYKNKIVASGAKTITYKKGKSSSTSYTKAKGKLPSDTAIANYLTDSAASYIASQIAPHKKSVSLNFLKGDNENIELGIEYVNKTRYKQAVSIFEQIANNNNSSQEDQAKALHNQGLVKLIRGQYTPAFELISKANILDPKNMEILDSLQMVEKYSALNEDHKKQTAK